MDEHEQFVLLARQHLAPLMRESEQRLNELYVFHVCSAREVVKIELAT
jgi:hypothetical protein